MPTCKRICHSWAERNRPRMIQQRIQRVLAALGTATGNEKSTIMFTSRTERVKGKRTRRITKTDRDAINALAMEARKPMFDLKPGDGAIGAHIKAVQICYQDFKALAGAILQRTDGPSSETVAA